MPEKNGKLPQHPEATAAKAIDVNGRLAEVTHVVYKDAGQLTGQDKVLLDNLFGQKPLKAPEGLQLLFGDVHGHSNYSDGCIDPEEEIVRMKQRVDFCVLTDHDHGGVDRDTLYTEKWPRLQKMAAEASVPGKFSVLVGYERDSYPWYDNLIVYFKDHAHGMLSGAVRGETNAEELAAWLKREDVFLAPHDTDYPTCSTDFTRRPKELMPHGIELISRGDCAEYFDHPLNVCCSVRGGSWRDALRHGAHPAALGGADSHDGTGAVDLPQLGFPERYPGMTGVWAAENTPGAIFEALRARHTFAYMGPKPLTVVFGVNGGLMGDILPEQTVNGRPVRRIAWHIESEESLAKVTLVKNGEPFFVAKKESAAEADFADYVPEGPEDSYYLQIELTDGRMAWTSPCWVTKP